MIEIAIPLMETPEQQRILDLEEQLEKEKKSHKETKHQLELNKSQLEIAEIKLLDRVSEVEGLKNTIQCLVQNQQFSKDNFEAENESKFQKLESEFEKVHKKFDDLKEQISKGQVQEEQKLKDLNEKLESENARLQEELSKSRTAAKWLEMKIANFEEAYAELKSRNADIYKEVTETIASNIRFKEQIEKLEETNVKKDTKIQELEKTIKQKECILDELEKKSSDVVDKFEKKDLEYEELKNKYEETIVKLNGMDKLQKAMEDLKLKHSQLQLQHQKQQLDKNASTDSDLSYSKELKECLSFLKKALDAGFKNDNNMYEKQYNEYYRCFNVLSAEDKKICNKMGSRYSEDLRKKKVFSEEVHTIDNIHIHP